MVFKKKKTKNTRTVVGKLQSGSGGQGRYKIKMPKFASRLQIGDAVIKKINK